MEILSLLNGTDSVVAGNTVGRWLLALLAVAGTYALLLVWRNVIGRRFARLAERTATKIDDLAAELVITTRPLFFIVIALYSGTLLLELPALAHTLLARGAVLVVILQGAFWGNRAINFFLNRYLRGRLASDASVASTFGLLSFFARFALWTVVMLLVLDNLGIDITAMVAGLGIGGIAIALALQNVLGDLLASLSIILDKPFGVGDFIIVGDLMGTVEQIGIKTTRLRSLSGEQLVFPNADLLGSRIRNYQRMQERRIVFAFGIVYQTPAEKVAAIPAQVREIIGQQPLARFDRCHFKGFGDSSLDFETVYYVRDPDYAKYMDTQQAINLALLRRFVADGVDFAYPTRTLFIEKQG